MRVTAGCTFETPGLYRKFYLDADEAEFPEAAALDPMFRQAYICLRLEQRLLYTRHVFGNLTTEQYQYLLAGSETLAAAYLNPPSAQADDDDTAVATA